MKFVNKYKDYRVTQGTKKTKITRLSDWQNSTKYTLKFERRHNDNDFSYTLK